MESNQYTEYTILNPKNGKFEQFVTNDGYAIIQICNSYLEVDGYFESEVRYLATYAEENGLKIYTRIKEFTPIEHLTNVENKMLAKDLAEKLMQHPNAIVK